jgi:soluble lytic murein transglycosylase-like protein
MTSGLAAAIAAGILALTSPSAIAEIVIEQRDGIFYVKSVEPPPPVVAAPLAGSPSGVIVTRPAAPYGELIRAAAARHGLASELVESVIRVESNFEARAVSPKGARGLMQLMPATAAKLGVRNVFDARQNIEGGVRHLRHLVDRYDGNLALALAAYNAGVEAVGRYGGIPPYPETQAYVARVLRLLQRAAPSASAEARVLRRYETADGHVVYSNLPIDKLSVTVREMLAERQ